jgi:hypothetical protein
MSKTDWEVRKRRLAELGFASYSDYLKSEHWASVKRSLKVSQCEVCGETTLLDLHHLNYVCLGRESPFDVATVCQTCHKRLHEHAQEMSVAIHFSTSIAWLTQKRARAMAPVLSKPVNVPPQPSFVLPAWLPRL